MLKYCYYCDGEIDQLVWKHIADVQVATVSQPAKDGMD